MNLQPGSYQKSDFSEFLLIWELFAHQRVLFSVFNDSQGLEAKLKHQVVRPMAGFRSEFLFRTGFGT